MSKRKTVTAYDLIKKAGPHYAPVRTCVFSVFEDNQPKGKQRKCLGVYSTSEAAWDKVERRKQKLGEAKSNSFRYDVVVYGLDQDVWGL